MKFKHDSPGYITCNFVDDTKWSNYKKRYMNGFCFSCPFALYIECNCLTKLKILAWGVLHVLLFLSVGSSVMWFFSSWKKGLFAKLRKFSKWQQFLFKTTTNFCNFVNFSAFQSSSFFLSIIKITWLNSQQPKTSHPGTLRVRNHP